jgi:hypothetical protein
MARINLLPDPSLEPFQAGLQARLTQVAARVNADNFADVLPALGLSLLLDAFERAGAHEGTIWLLDAGNQCLVPAWNNGPDAAALGAHRQPLRKGLVSMVFANEQPFVMNRESAEIDRGLDDRLRVRTCALIAVPFYFLGNCRGVISCVQLRRGDGPEPAGFEAEALTPVQRAADALHALIDADILARTVGVAL